MHINDLSHQIIGCAMRIHSQLGPGLRVRKRKRGLNSTLLFNHRGTQRISRRYTKDCLCAPL
jgi:hypothetical protein